MKCEKARALLSERENGELDERGESRLVHHLQRCAVCRQAADELGQMLQLLGAVEPPALPEDFAPTLRERLLAESGAPRPARAEEPGVQRPLWVRAARGAGLAAAGAAAAVLVLWAAGGPTPQTAITPTAPADRPARSGATPSVAKPAASRLRVGEVAVLVMTIRSERSHEDARLQVVLPDGVSLLGEGARDLEEKRMEWSARLRKGDNLIRIPVRARRPGTWQLVARARAAGLRSNSTTRLVVTRS